MGSLFARLEVMHAQQCDVDVDEGQCFFFRILWVAGWVRHNQKEFWKKITLTIADDPLLWTPFHLFLEIM